MKIKIPSEQAVGRMQESQHLRNNHTNGCCPTQCCADTADTGLRGEISLKFKYWDVPLGYTVFNQNY